MKKKIAVLCLISLCFAITAQEALLSAEEEYYDFLALDGYIERPYLNFRTLSDSQWSVDSDTGTIWDRADSRKTKQITKKINYQLYGPDLFNSFNSAAPYGQNDGSLWQGKGLNSSLTGGFRLEGYGFELTVKPQVTFSQNTSFTLMPSTYDSEFGYIWGFGQNIGVDAPQRFGDKSYFDFSWGDSEIRYTWKTLTIGFGTQSPWIGSGHVNSLLHSNNAAPYPKVDFGIRKTQIHIWGWYAGDIEARLSQNFQFQWPSTFYGHSQITQGYTNEGQWLGAGIGTGGNCQFAGFKIYYPKGFHNIFIYRVNPDNDFLYKNTIQTTLSTSDNGTSSDFYRFKSSYSIGIQSMYFLRKNLSINGGLVYNLILTKIT